MLWIILFAALFLVGVGCLIGTHFMDEYSDAYDILHMFGLVLTIVCGITLILLAIFAYQANVPGSMFNQESRIDLDNTIKELNATFAALSMNEGATNEPLTIASVNEYNAQVNKFKTGIENGQYRRNNLWTSWFTSNIWAEYTGNEVQFFPAN